MARPDPRAVVQQGGTDRQERAFAKTVSESDVYLFAGISGDFNPAHINQAYAEQTAFKTRIAHGMLSGALMSAALAMELPGPGAVYIKQSLTFRLPVKVGDTVTIQLEVTDKKDRRRFVTLDCKAVNQNGKVVANGTAEVIAPADKIMIERPEVPQVSLVG